LAEGQKGSLPWSFILNLFEENTLQAVKLGEKEIEWTQHQLASELGFDFGKTLYRIKFLIDIGWIKLDNFYRSNNQRGYAYLMAPLGLAEQAAVTVRFLARKKSE